MVQNEIIFINTDINPTWRKLSHRGSDVFLRVTPGPEFLDLPGFVNITVEIAARRGGDWRFGHQTATGSVRDRVSQFVKEQVDLLVASLDNEDAVASDDYAPLIAELSAL